MAGDSWGLISIPLIKAHGVGFGVQDSGDGLPGFSVCYLIPKPQTLSDIYTFDQGAWCRVCVVQGPGDGLPGFSVWYLIPKPQTLSDIYTFDQGAWCRVCVVQGSGNGLPGFSVWYLNTKPQTLSDIYTFDQGAWCWDGVLRLTQEIFSPLHIASIVAITKHSAWRYFMVQDSLLPP